MKSLSSVLLLSLAILGCKESNKKTNPNPVADAETVVASVNDLSNDGDWTILFDGTSFKGWHGYLSDEVSEAWKLEDGAMVLYPPERKEGGTPNLNVISDKNYSDFVLSLEWKISKKASSGNSGIFWGIKEDAMYPVPARTAPEIQVLDNQHKPNIPNNRRAGALYDLVAPLSDMTKPIGQWNTCILTVNHKINSGKVTLNGTEISNFPLQGSEWDAMVSKSKFADWEGYGTYKTGKIGLQYHGNAVSYRNIRIKEL